MSSPAKVRIFFSWQSDSPAATNANAIRDALKVACKKVSGTAAKIEFIRDEATRGTSGSPNIAHKIQEKIDSADIFIADITTITSKEAGRPCPNPNVVFELGYAVSQLGWDRVIMLFNKEFGQFPNDLPFDFIQNRVSLYHIETSKPNNGKAHLENLLQVAVSAVVKLNPKRPHELRGVSKEKLQHDHDVDNIKWALSSIHIPTMDDLIERLPGYIIDQNFFFYEGFKGVIQNSLFSLYDSNLDKSFQKLYDSWSTALSYPGMYHDTANGKLHVFTNPGDMPLTSDKQEVWDAIDGARTQMREALDEILARVRESYLEVNIKNSNKKAWNEYIEWIKDDDNK
ncbi:TIR domain-containing protein [Azospirillum sp. A29]|uniref:TIR domain-containing protein n=1 Tax=unclassified Azospirillum TaxID=2630922 RepID=UPI00366FDBF9